VCKKLIKNSQPFGENFQKTVGGIFFDSHCSSSSDHNLKLHHIWISWSLLQLLALFVLRWSIHITAFSLDSHCYEYNYEYGFLCVDY